MVETGSKDDKPDPLQGLRLYPDDPLSESSKKEYLFREKSQYFDPCKEASKMSMSCLERNNYDRSQCKQYFEIYRDCMAAWKRGRKK